MSRMQKFAEWLCKGYQNSTLDEYIQDWTPHNLKTLLFSGEEVAVEYFVPYNGTKVEHYLLQDVPQDMKLAMEEKPVKGLLKALNVYKIFSNIEEIIITSDKYSRVLFDIDVKLSDLSITGSDDFTEVFPRLYSITKTTCTFQEVFSIIAQTGEGQHLHFSDILKEQSANLEGKTIVTKHYNKDDWMTSIALEEKYYAMDKQDAELNTYLKAVLTATKGEVELGSIIEKVEQLSDFFSTIELNTIKLPTIKGVTKKPCVLEFFRSDLFSPSTSATKVRMYISDAILDNIGNMFGGLYNIHSLTITSGNQIVVNEVYQIVPKMGYNQLYALPDSIFETLLNMTKEKFKRKVSEHFKRIPSLDSDAHEFETWLVESMSLNWGYLFNFKDIYKFTNLSCLSINNPYRIHLAKAEAGLTNQNWSTLYTKIPPLSTKGIYLDGAYVSEDTEHAFMGIEKALSETATIMLEFNKSRGLFNPQIGAIDDNSVISKGLNKVLGKSRGAAVTNQLSNISAKLTTFYRKFDT